MNESVEISINCDPETGLCVIPDVEKTVNSPIWKDGEEIIYIGDPMCSWCWGISPHLNALQRYGHQRSIPFTLVMGGLRPGGGQEWNEDFKQFLRHHWHQVNEKSGQPFGFGLFELSEFDYDTEPACRAVIASRSLTPENTLRFYELVQHHFYVKSNDPKQIDFYLPICRKLNIDFNAFSQSFTSTEVRQSTYADFARSREWGVSGFPTVLYRKNDQLQAIARGYTTYQKMKERITAITI